MAGRLWWFEWDVPIFPSMWILDPQLVMLLGRLRKGGLAGGTSWLGRLWGLKASSCPQDFSACSSRYSLSQLFCCHACLLPCFSTTMVMDSYPSRTISSSKLFRLPWSWCFFTSTQADWRIPCRCCLGPAVPSAASILVCVFPFLLVYLYDMKLWKSHLFIAFTQHIYQITTVLFYLLGMQT